MTVERTLGILLAKVEGIEKGMARADEHRATVHRRMDDLVDEVGALQSDMTAVKAKVEKVETVSDDVIALRYQAQGAGTLGHWLIKIGIGVVAAAGWLVSFYTYLTGRPPP